MQWSSFTDGAVCSKNIFLSTIDGEVLHRHGSLSLSIMIQQQREEQTERKATEVKLFRCKDDCEWVKTHLVFIPQYQNHGFQLASVLSRWTFHSEGGHRSVVPLHENSEIINRLLLRWGSYTSLQLFTIPKWNSEYLSHHVNLVLYVCSTPKQNFFFFSIFFFRHILLQFPCSQNRARWIHA